MKFCLLLNKFSTLLGRSSRRYYFVFLCLIFLVFLCLSYTLWLPLFGSFLVTNDRLEPSDVLIVLGTHPNGERVDWAAKLYKRGLAAKVIMCGYKAGWKTSTAEIMKKQALALGIPEDKIILDYGWNTHGTWDNARNSLKIIADNNFSSAIVVTSNYHTRRSKLAFNKIFRNTNLKILISGCPDSFFRPNQWWENRESAETIFYEYTKLIYYFLVSPIN